MTDLKGTPGGEGGRVNSYYDDMGDGTYAERHSAILRGWDSTDGLAYKVPVDHVTGALMVKATLAAGTVDVGIVDQGAAGATAWKVTDAGLSDGTLRVGGTVTVTGPLTDTQLRATPVTITGTVTATTGGLTDTQLRATPVPVSLSALPALAAGSAVIGHVIVDTAPSTAVTNVGTFAVQATLAAETTKVIGAVAQSTSPWVSQDTTAKAVPSTGTLPAYVDVIAGYDGTYVLPVTVRMKDGVNMIHTADQQARQELEYIRVVLLEQTDILRQLVGERADLN